jgi:hypothetical protein
MVDFIVFSDDWGRHPSSSQHLFRRMPPGSRALWVETIGLRPPRLTTYDARRILEKVRGWISPAAAPAEPPWCETPPGLFRFAPPMHPFYGSPLGAATNDALLTRLIRRRLAALGFERPVIVTTVPNACGLVGRLGEKAAVYYCVDDFETWPGYAGGAIRAMEARLLARVDGLVVTAAALGERRGRPGLPLLSLPHGVDVELFAAGGPRPSTLTGLPAPLLMSSGLYDERVDTELLGAVLDAHPTWHLALVGRRTAPPNPLDAHPRVRTLPGVPYTQVPAVLAAADVLLVPYRRNAQTDTINPLKLREFLATGRPVAATALPEVVAACGDLVPTGDGPAAFGAAIERALALAPETAAARRACVRPDAWEARAALFFDFVARVAAGRRDPA